MADDRLAQYQALRTEELPLPTACPYKLTCLSTTSLIWLCLPVGDHVASAESQADRRARVLENARKVRAANVPAVTCGRPHPQMPRRMSHKRGVAAAQSHRDSALRARRMEMLAEQQSPAAQVPTIVKDHMDEAAAAPAVLATADIVMADATHAALGTAIHEAAPQPYVVTTAVF